MRRRRHASAIGTSSRPSRSWSEISRLLSLTGAEILSKPTPLSRPSHERVGAPLWSAAGLVGAPLSLRGNGLPNGDYCFASPEPQPIRWVRGQRLARGVLH